MSQTTKSTSESSKDDPKYSSNSNYESLFDSGYNSNMQSSAFLELDSATSIDSSSHHHHHHHHHHHMTSSTSVSGPRRSIPQWSDSGLSITDSGLGIVEDDPERYDDDMKGPKKTRAPLTPAEKLKEDALKSWLADNNNVADALLHLAIVEDLEAVACSIVENIPDPEDLDSYNYLYQTPLHLAVLARQIDVIRLLIGRGVNIAFQDGAGNTPLHVACKYSLIDIVNVLLTSSSSSSSSTSSPSSTSTRTSLIARKCAEMHNFDGETCLHLAVQTNNLKLVELLLFYGTNINAQEAKSGKTILHYAVESLNVPLVELLLRKNPNINVRTFSNKTPIHFALEMHHSHALAKDPIAKGKIEMIVGMLTDSYNDLKVSLDELSSNSSADSQSEYAEEDTDTDED